jgi:L-asparaginase II
MADYTPVKFLEYERSGLIEQEHFGLLVKVSADGKVFKLGDDKNYPFYLRSCAKPLQASLLIDFGLDEFYNMTNKEIALCCASHAGEICHVQAGRDFLKKIGLSEKHLKCGLHKPLNKNEQNKLILSGEKENILQNNCSGKHIMMLALCKKMGWGLDDYDEISHPLQIAIQKKIYELCELPPTTQPNEDFKQKLRTHLPPRDGCGVPIYAMPLENMVQGFLNLFLDDKYHKIREAFIQNPYIIGGEDRLDTAIINANKNLIAKVGAGGLCIVVNLEKQEGLIIKIMDCDMKARAICLIEALKQLNWLDGEMLENDLIKSQNKRDILTLHGEKIGEAKVNFKMI